MAAMPKGPQGQKRPADVVSNAIHVARLATHEAVEEYDPPAESAQTLGAKGGKNRAERLSPERRSEIAKKAAQKRWAKP